jgi:hypothetical protein
MVSRRNGSTSRAYLAGLIREHDVTYDLAVSGDVVVVTECLLEQELRRGRIVRSGHDRAKTTWGRSAGPASSERPPEAAGG